MRWALVVLVAVMAVTGCRDSEASGSAESTPSTEAFGELRPEAFGTGFAISPRSFDGDDLPDFLELVEGEADVLMHAGDWGGLDQENSPFHVMSTLAARQGQEAAIVLSPSSGPDMIRPLDQVTHDRYLASLRSFLAERKPAFLGLANEVNMLAVRDPDGFERVVALWDEALPIVRELSPRTKVFVSFQYERTVGRHDGWFGGQVVEPDWSIIDRFEGMDVAAFTTYPSLVLDDPDDLDADYYTQIADHTDLPVVFTEIGWTADPDIAILPGSEGEQVDYLEELEAQMCQLDTELLIWTFVHGDQVDHVPFAEMDLWRDDGTPRPAWQRWADLGC